MWSTLKANCSKLVNYVKWLYMLYELNTQISICEPWEKVFLNTLLFVLTSLFVYSAFAYIPGYLVLLIKYITPTDLGNVLPTASDGSEDS